MCTVTTTKCTGNEKGVNLIIKNVHTGKKGVRLQIWSLISSEHEPLFVFVINFPLLFFKAKNIFLQNYFVVVILDK